MKIFISRSLIKLAYKISPVVAFWQVNFITERIDKLSESQDILFDCNDYEFLEEELLKVIMDTDRLI